LFPIIFSEYAAEYPDTVLEIHELGIQRILKGIVNEHHELGFIVLSEKSQAYATLPFSAGQLFVILPAEHRFCLNENISFAALKDECFILVKGGSYIKEKVMAECKKHNFTPNIVFTPLQVATAFNIVASGAGISFVLSDDIPIIKDNPRIKIKPLADPIEFQTGFVWSKSKYLSKIARDFIQFIKNSRSKKIKV
jgi:DNA-binding transcriptional LysR family regulator